ncbi:MAG: 5'/3'-nucleotidase SurE [Acidobacteria bacterium]|nr:5'/3'-nucleotidase SurE [Acidobacteriota bacterium]
MACRRFLVTNDDGWDAPGLAALVSTARRFGEVIVVAPASPQSYCGHRVNTDRPMQLTRTGEDSHHLDGSPADCVRVALRGLGVEACFVLSGINRGGNLGADLYTSGTCAAAREAVLLGVPAIAVSQYVQRGLQLDWAQSEAIFAPVLERLLDGGTAAERYWNVNLPHVPGDFNPRVVECLPDIQPLDVRFREDSGLWRYDGSYINRPRTPGRDVELCFSGAVTVSAVAL